MSEVQLNTKKRGSSFQLWLRALGSSALVAGVQIGPGTMSSTLFAGSGFGLNLLWLVALSGVWLAALTMMAGTVTVVTGKTTLQALDRHVFKGWGKVNGWVQVVCNIGAVIGVSVGMADAFKVFFPNLSTFLSTLILLVISLFFMVLRGKYSFIKSMISVIVGAMVVLFVLNIFFVKINFFEALSGLVPTIPAGSLIAVTGIIGGSIGGLPMLFYPYQVKAAGFKKEDLPVMRWDNIMFLGVAFSLISVSVLLAGSALHAPGAAPVQNAIQAANALAPIGGSAAKWLFSLGFFAVVWSTAVSPCFGTGYYVADLLNFKTKGDEEKALIDGDIHSDTRFKILSGLTMVSWLLGPLVAKVVAPFIVIMIAMGILNLFTPFIIASLFYISTSKKIMGKYAIGWFHRLTIAVGFAFSIVGVWSFISFLKSTFF